MEDLLAVAQTINALSPTELATISRDDDLFDLVGELRGLPFDPTVEAAIYRLEFRLYLATALDPTVH